MVEALFPEEEFMVYEDVNRVHAPSQFTETELALL